MLNMLLVLRWNTKLGISDQYFVIGDNFASAISADILFMAVITLVSRLCPPGIEAMCIGLIMMLGEIGRVLSDDLGGVLTKVFNVTCHGLFCQCVFFVLFFALVCCFFEVCLATMFVFFQVIVFYFFFMTLVGGQSHTHKKNKINQKKTKMVVYRK